MAGKSKGMLAKSRFNDVAAKEWSCPKNGLRKELIDFKFTSMTKPTELSKCLVKISNVKNLNDRETAYLNKSDEEIWIQLGAAVTPVDYYLEILLQQMFSGETSRCFIQTKSSIEISFTVHLLSINFNNYAYKLSVAETYNLALQYKQNGVAMFKKYPKFAQEYFCRAAKLLISYQPFDVLKERQEGIDPEELKSLLENLQTNIAACLMKEGRYEDVLHVTEFVNEEGANGSEKARYRRAVALCNLQKFEEAKELIERRDYKGDRDFAALHNRMMAEWKQSDEKYSSMVKKMFG